MGGFSTLGERAQVEPMLKPLSQVSPAMKLDGAGRDRFTQWQIS